MRRWEHITFVQRGCIDVNATLYIRHVPTRSSAGTTCRNNVDSTLIQRQDVESTLNRHCFNVSAGSILDRRNYSNLRAALASEDVGGYG